MHDVLGYNKVGSRASANNVGAFGFLCKFEHASNLILGLSEYSGIESATMHKACLNPGRHASVEESGVASDSCNFETAGREIDKLIYG